MTAGTTLGALAPATAAAAAVAPARPYPVPRPVPSTRYARRLVRDGRLRVVSTDFPLTHLGVTWRGPVAQVRIRTERGWSRWQTIDGCVGGRDGYEHEEGAALLVAPEAVGYEVWVAGGATAQVTEFNTAAGSISTLASVAASMPLPGGMTCDVPYLSRAAWGADESLRFTDGEEDFPPEYHPVQTLTVHHSGFGNDDPDPAATVRAIYHNQTVDKGWGDIGYQLLIDEAGRVYEGRWSGSDAVPGFDGALGADGLPRMSTGAHVGGYNSGNFGICLLGDFTDRLPTAAARESLVTVLAALARVCWLDPLANTTYVNPVSDATKVLSTIPGHRDWDATQCPGNLFYPALPTLRTDVDYRLARLSLPPRRPGLVRGTIPRR